MKKLIFLLLGCSASLSAQNINIPDAVLKSRLLSADVTNSIALDNAGNSIKIDTDGNGEITNTEALQVYQLDISNPDYMPGEFLISDLTGLEYFAFVWKFDCAMNQISNFDPTMFGSLGWFDCHGNNLASLSVNNYLNMQYLDCSFNELTSIDVSHLVNLQHFNCRANQLTSIDISNQPAMGYFSIGGNDLTSIDLSANIALTELDCSANAITAIDLSPVPNLTNLNCSDNQLTSIDLTPVPDLTALEVGRNQLTSLGISHLAGLQDFGFSENQISSMDFSGQTNLRIVVAADNLLTSFDTSQMQLVYFLNINSNNLTTIDLSPMPLLGGLLCDGNQLTTLDASANPILVNINCADNLMETLFIKNGAITSGVSNFTLSGNPDLHYICADEAEAAYIQNQIIDAALTDCFVSTYCTFTPGGNYNTMTGTILFDSGNDGCSAADPGQPNVKLSITDGTNTGASFSNQDGLYNFYTLVGNFTVSPQVENPSFFNFSPASATELFIDANNNVRTNNICVTANGVHPDVEIVIAPMDRARPGFDATYKIVYKNKGNQVLSGNVTFDFDDSVLDLVSSTVAPDVETIGHFEWAYTDLLPFESRSVTTIFNINGPMETPAVNLDDVLTFNASVTPSDEFADDNQFTLNQTVVNAFDPNDISCLEGNNVPVSMIGKYLHYMVNFENLGSAEAENVVVKIEIDPDLYDVSSIQQLETSHVSRSVVTGNRIEFLFESINLEAAGGNPPVGGHGNVLFKIKSNNGLETGDFVSKKANIYFDYNFPIETNDAETVFQELSNGDFTKDASIVAYPNPSDGIVEIKASATIKTLHLFDVQGRLLQTVIGNNTSEKIDISDRSSGIYFLKATSENGVNVMKIARK